MSEVQKTRSSKQQAVFAAARHKAHEQAALRTGRYIEIGKIGGRMTAAIPGHMSRAGSLGGKIGGAVQGNINAANGHLHYARHRRWHVLAGKAPKKFCRFCPQKKQTT